MQQFQSSVVVGRRSGVDIIQWMLSHTDPPIPQRNSSEPT
jgi:hypothetical protein